MDSEPEPAQVLIPRSVETHEQRRTGELPNQRQLLRRPRGGTRLAEQASERLRHPELPIAEQL